MNMLLAVTILVAGASPADSWPAFRGTGNSVSDATDVPLEWSDSSNLKWRIPLVGYGQSSPIIWNGQVFVTTMVGKDKEKSTVLCYELESGKKIWSKEFPSSQTTTASNFVSRSAPTPCCDSKRVYAFFEGGELIALTHSGETVWQRSLVKDYGGFSGNHGVGSSLAINGNAIYVLVNHGGPSYLLACDKLTGHVLWKNDYESRVSWSSPVIHSSPGVDRVVVSAAERVDVYDAEKGNSTEHFEGLKGNTVPSATLFNEKILVGTSDVRSGLVLSFNGAGKLETEFEIKKASSTFSSPLVYRNCIYSVNRAGVAFCNRADTGSLHWSKRIGGSCWASHVGVEDRVYFFGKDGTTTVVQAGGEYRVLATNPLTVKDSTKVYGVAVVQGHVVLRTGNELLCIGQAIPPSGNEHD